MLQLMTCPTLASLLCQALGNMAIRDRRRRQPPPPCEHQCVWQGKVCNMQSENFQHAACGISPKQPISPAALYAVNDMLCTQPGRQGGSLTWSLGTMFVTGGTEPSCTPAPWLSGATRRRLPPLPAPCAHVRRSVMELSRGCGDCAQAHAALLYCTCMFRYMDTEPATADESMQGRTLRSCSMPDA